MFIVSTVAAAQQCILPMWWEKVTSGCTGLAALPSRTFIVLWYILYLVKQAVNPNKHHGLPEESVRLVKGTMWLCSWCWRRQHGVSIQNREASTIKQGLCLSEIIRTSNVPLETQPECVALTWKRCFHLHQWVLELFHFGACLPRAGAAWDRAPWSPAPTPVPLLVLQQTFCLKLASVRSWKKSWRWRFQVATEESWTVVLKINRRIKKTGQQRWKHAYFAPRAQRQL